MKKEKLITFFEGKTPDGDTLTVYAQRYVVGVYIAVYVNKTIACQTGAGSVKAANRKARKAMAGLTDVSMTETEVLPCGVIESEVQDEVRTY